MLGNQPVRFGKGELETCQRLESGNGECRFNRSRQPFWRRGNAPAIYFMRTKGHPGYMLNCGLLGPPPKFTTLRSLPIKKQIKKQIKKHRSIKKSCHVQDNLTPYHL